MSEKVVLIPNGEQVYAVPVEIYQQFALAGDKLNAAKLVLKGSGIATEDVEGQSCSYSCYGRSSWGSGPVTYDNNLWRTDSYMSDAN